MSQIVQCPKCNVRVAVGDRQAGRRVKCPACSKPFLTAASLTGGLSSVEDDEEDWLGLDAALDSKADSAKHKSGGTPQTEQRFRIRCPVCESIQYARVSMVGQSIRCDDCHSAVKIPRPPKSVIKTSVAANQPPAPQVSRSQNTSVRADGLLKSAEDEAIQASSSRSQQAQRMRAWTPAVLRVFTDVGVILHLVALAVFLAVPVGVTVYRPTLGFGTFPFMVIAFSLVMTCGLAIVQSVANGDQSVDDWPTIDIFAWMESTLIIGSALVCSVTPALFLATLVSAGTLVTVALMLMGAHLIFPYVVLSLLDNQSIFVPISIDVFRGFRNQWRECRVFYFAAGATLCIPVVYFWFAPETPVAAGIGAAVCVFVAFLYAAILGRLAFVLGLAGEVMFDNSIPAADEAGRI